MRRKTYRRIAVVVLALWVLVPASVRAEITIVLKNSFIEQHKRRVTIDASFTVDKAHERPNPPSKDGDLHIAGRSDDVKLPIVAEIMNARDAAAAVEAIHDAERNRKAVEMTGAWRIWCEHGGTTEQEQGAPLKRFKTTNPDHVFEIHPVTKLDEQNLLPTLKPIKGYHPKDAETAFTKYEGIRCEIVPGDETTTVVTTMAGYNYVEFIMEISSEPFETDDGLMVMCKVRDLEGELLVRHRRMVMVKDSEVEKKTRGQPIGTRLHVLGIPRIDLSLISWRVKAAAAGRKEVLTWGLPYEIIVVGFYEYVKSDDEEDDESESADDDCTTAGYDVPFLRDHPKLVVALKEHPRLIPGALLGFGFLILLASHYIGYLLSPYKSSQAHIMAQRWSLSIGYLFTALAVAVAVAGFTGRVAPGPGAGEPSDRPHPDFTPRDIPMTPVPPPAAAEVCDMAVASGEAYPSTLRQLEHQAVVERRRQAGTPATANDLETVGLALSGGGVRSATFNLGVLQALARRGLLRAFDFLSTVSGGGYIGGFVGRALSRHSPDSGAMDSVERELANSSSPSIAWLRQHSNYLSAAGRGDHFVNAAVYLRNLLTLHLVLGLLLFGFVGFINLVRYWALPWLLHVIPECSILPVTPADLPLGRMLRQLFPGFWDVWSPWLMLVELTLLLAVVPLGLAYWAAAHEGPGHYSKPALAALFTFIALLLAVGVAGFPATPTFFGVLSLLAVFLYTERAWWVARARGRLAVYGPTGQTLSVERDIANNRLGYWLGDTLWYTGIVFFVALADTAGHELFRQARATSTIGATLARCGAGLVAIMSALRASAGMLGGMRSFLRGSLVRLILGMVVPWLIFAVLVFVLTTLLAYLSHWAYQGGTTVGIGASAMGLALALSWFFRWSIRFINDSSVQAVYAARLGRTYLGATNPVRFRSRLGRSIVEAIPGDDIRLREYHPHTVGGPIHLVNTTVNHTTDYYSQRVQRDRQADILAVGAFGLSVGPIWHALWGEREGQLVAVGEQTGTRHPFVTATPTEELTLEQWLAISGAAVGPGRGPETSSGLSLVFSVVSLRTGYWWDSGQRLGGYRGWRDWLMELLPHIFLPQFLLYYEFIGRYAGPWARWWYLSDGGFFENLGVYELIRRRVRHIVCCDATQDGSFTFDDLGNMLRKARIDFRADVRFLTVAELDGLALDPAVRTCLGDLDELRPNAARKLSQKHAVLAFVYYDNDTRPDSVLLYVKSSLTGDEPADVRSFRADNPDFPHDPTINQFFDERQWESYRMLGDHVGSKLLVAAVDGRLWLTGLRPWADPTTAATA